MHGTSAAAATEPDEIPVRRVARLTAAVGAAYALLYLLSLGLLSRVPGGLASDAEIQRFYASDSKRLPIVAGLYVMPFAGIAFIWFVVLLRMWIRADADRRNHMQSNIQLASGLLFVAIFFVSAAAMSVFAATAEFTGTAIDPSLARQFPDFAYTLLLVFGMRMAAMFVFTSSALGMRTGVMPRWFALVGFAVGAFLLLSATLATWLAIVFPAWVLALCLLMFRRAREIPRELVIPQPTTPTTAGVPMRTER